jgi:MFS family permease
MDRAEGTSPDPRRVARARFAVSIAFLMLGIGPGLWAVHIPLVQERLGINPGVLGIGLLVLAAGAVISMPVMGWAVGHIGSRLPTAIGALLFMIVVPLPILAPTVPLFFLALFLFGVLMGTIDVAGNVQAADVEKLRGRPTMSSFHAFYSIGALAGALAGAFVIGRGWGGGSGAAGICGVLFVIGAFSVGHLLPSDEAGAGPKFALPSRAVLGLGLIAGLVFAIEGAVTDWSALFLTGVKVATPETAAFGFAAYALAMAGLRLVGDPIVERLGPRRIVVGGGLLCILGLAIALVSPWPLVAALGFGLVGLGAANIAPVCFSAGTRVPGVAPGVGVSAVVTMGYTGFLVFPPILGFAAELLGLAAAIGIVLAMSAAMAILGLRQRF